MAIRILSPLYPPVISTAKFLEVAAAVEAELDGTKLAHA